MLRSDYFQSKKKLDQSMSDCDYRETLRYTQNFHISMIELADQSTPLQETFYYQPEEE